MEDMVTKALRYSTPLGYIWMFLLFTFRMFITAVVGSSVYGDESVSNLNSKILPETIWNNKF